MHAIYHTSKCFSMCVGVCVQYHTSPERNSLLESINNLLPNRFQIVVLNGETSEWKKIMQECHRAILGLLFCIIYVNDVSDGILSLLKFFFFWWNIALFSHPDFHSKTYWAVSWWNYNLHINKNLSKVYKGTGLLRNLSNELQWQVLNLS